MRERLAGQVAAGVERERAARRSSVSSSRKPYRSGSVTTATEWKFFAAARTIAGPPMSMFAITSASGTPRRIATERNG